MGSTKELKLVKSQAVKIKVKQNMILNFIKKYITHLDPNNLTVNYFVADQVDVN